ncbi:LysR family transcriptional regulator [Thalassococcus sp. S3]|nr:LysR family transcriptional regulator [Thalassococcus sp. S3]
MGVDKITTVMRNAAELAFLKTIQLGSIRAAARALGQDPSGVSRRITQLEQRLGAHLVDRSGGKTSVTEQGRLYYERLKVIIEQWDALEAEVSGEVLHPSGMLRVTASIDFGQEFVTDWLLEFRASYPQVDFDLVLSGGYLDLSQNVIDVAIRVGRLPDSSLIARKLASVPRVLVASPKYLERVGVPQTPDDLSDHEFVFFSSRNRTEKLFLQDDSGKTFEVARSGGVAVNAVRSAVKAVQAGQGIHSGPLWAFADLIDNEEVTVVLPSYKQNAAPLYAVRQPAVIVPARISEFVEFIANKAAGVNGLISSR